MVWLAIVSRIFVFLFFVGCFQWLFIVMRGHLWFFGYFCYFQWFRKVCPDGVAGYSLQDLCFFCFFGYFQWFSIAFRQQLWFFRLFWLFPMILHSLDKPGASSRPSHVCTIFVFVFVFLVISNGFP